MLILKCLLCFWMSAGFISASPVSAEEAILTEVLAIPWGDAEGEIGLKRGDVGEYWVVPASFAVDARTGDVVIADEANSRISRFSAAGKLILSIDVRKKAKYYYPMDVELDSQGGIIVFDNEKIQVFDTQGKPLDVLPVRGGSISQDNIFIDANDSIYLRDPEWIMKFVKGQGQAVVYEQESLAQYGSAIITRTGNILSLRDSLMTLSDGTDIIKQVRVETSHTGRPIGIDRDGNVYLFARHREQLDKSRQSFVIQKIDTDGKLVSAKELSVMEPVKYQGKSINLRMWEWHRTYIDLDGSFYFLEATPAGAEIRKLSIPGENESDTSHGDDIVAKTRELLHRYREGDEIENGVQKSQLHHDVYAAIYRELLRIKDEEAFPVFFAALSDTSERVRAVAVGKMVTFKKKEAVETLITMLESDPSVEVRSAAASSLGQMGYEDAGRHLLDALDSQESRVVQMAMRGLGYLKYRDAVEPLKGKLRGDNEKDWLIQWEAGNALKRITGQDWSQGIHPFPPEMRVRDEQLTLEAYEKAMKFLRESFPGVLHEAKTVDEITSSEYYYIGYFNSITTIQGYFLKQNVLLRKMQLEQALQARERGEIKETDVQETRLLYDQAGEAYRHFLDNTGWVD